MNGTTEAPALAARPLTDHPTIEATSLRGLWFGLWLVIPFWLLIAALAAWTTGQQRATDRGHSGQGHSAGTGVGPSRRSRSGGAHTACSGGSATSAGRCHDPPT